MRAFTVPTGTTATVLSDAYPMPKTETVTTKREAMYFLEDVTVDPLGVLTTAARPGDRTIGGDYAKAGFYGFRLPANSRGYSTILVPASAVDVH